MDFQDKGLPLDSSLGKHPLMMSRQLGKLLRIVSQPRHQPQPDEMELTRIPDAIHQQHIV